MTPDEFTFRPDVELITAYCEAAHGPQNARGCREARGDSRLVRNALAPSTHQTPLQATPRLLTGRAGPRPRTCIRSSAGCPSGPPRRGAKRDNCRVHLLSASVNAREGLCLRPEAVRSGLPRGRETGLGDDARVDEHVFVHRLDAVARESTAGPASAPDDAQARARARSSHSPRRSDERLHRAGRRRTVAGGGQ
jgi:hypothetical protein